MKLLDTVLLLSLFTCVEMWPRGAPNTTCISMMPGHGKPQQTGPSAYRLTVSKTTYNPDERIKLTLSGSTTFKGFLIKPTYAPDETPASGIGLPGTISFAASTESVGTFLTSPEAKDNCPTPSLTHTNNDTKNVVDFIWIAPSSDQGPIVFRYTVVQSKDIYWVNQASDIIRFYQEDSSEATTDASTAKPDNSSSRVRPSIIVMFVSFLSRVFKRLF